MRFKPRFTENKNPKNLKREPLYTMSEFGRANDIHKSTLSRLLKKHPLEPALKNGVKKLFTITALNKWYSDIKSAE